MSIFTKKNAVFTYGIIDIIRGTLHTIFVKHASKNIAGIVKDDMSTKSKNNIHILMNGFGASNFQTGILKILISRSKKKKNSTIIYLFYNLYYLYLLFQMLIFKK